MPKTARPRPPAASRRRAAAPASEPVPTAPGGRPPPEAAPPPAEGAAPPPHDALGARQRYGWTREQKGHVADTLRAGHVDAQVFVDDYRRRSGDHLHSVGGISTRAGQSASDLGLAMAPGLSKALARLGAEERARLRSRAADPEGVEAAEGDGGARAAGAGFSLREEARLNEVLLARLPGVETPRGMPRLDRGDAWVRAGDVGAIFNKSPQWVGMNRTAYRLEQHSTRSGTFYKRSTVLASVRRTMTPTTLAAMIAGDGGADGPAQWALEQPSLLAARPGGAPPAAEPAATVAAEAATPAVPPQGVVAERAAAFDALLVMLAEGVLGGPEAEEHLGGLSAAPATAAVVRFLAAGRFSLAQARAALARVPSL